MDAPRFTVVQACSEVGFRNPEDVRWCRLGRFLNEEGAPRGAFWGLSFGARE